MEEQKKQHTRNSDNDGMGIIGISPDSSPDRSQHYHDTTDRHIN